MDEAGEESLLRQLLAENRRLKDKIFQLEEQIGRKHDTSARDATTVTQVRRLLEQKDRSLEQYATELEANVDQLRRKNEMLQMWMSALRLYQDLFEHDASAMIGVNRDGKVVLFNKTAVEALGEGVRLALGHDIASIDFSHIDPDIPRLVHGALDTGHNASSPRTSVFALGTEDQRAALVRISLAPPK